jgi:hypothetical protein
MYWPKPGTKRDPQRRWNLPDRIFFGHGACHILAGVFLKHQPLPGFYAERIVPDEGFWGNHIYVTNGSIVFDFHGYSARERLLRHHRLGWSKRYPGWDAEIEKVDYSLLDTAALNARKMLGPDQYVGDPVARAEGFIERVNHPKAARKAECIAAF